MAKRVGVVAAVLAASFGTTVLATPTPAHAADTTFTQRYTAQGWGDLTQTGAAVARCTEPTCLDGSDPSLPTSWVDIDQDPSTVNSSRAVLTIPPRADVDWVGLYWAGDRASRADGAAPRCEAAPESATPPTVPPAPDRANQVKLSIRDQPYATVTANSVVHVAGPGGGAGFQAYLDITALVRPATRSTDPTLVPLTVAEIQAAQGPGCGGGWTAVLAYSYQDGPDATYAPDYRSIGVYDGTLPLPAGQSQQIQLDGVPASTQDGPQARLVSSLFGSGQALGSGPLTFGAATVARTGGAVTAMTPGPGYQQATSPVAAAAVKPGATVGLTSPRGGFLTGVLGVSTPLPVKVALTLATVVDPPAATVGSDATLTVTLTNDGDHAASGVKVAVQLPAGLRLNSPPPRFEDGVWSPDPVAPRSSATLSLPVRVIDAGDLVSTARITASNLPNQNPTDEAVSVTVTAAPSPTGGAATAPEDDNVISADAGSWTLTEVAPAILFGTGLFLLGVLLLSLIVVRNRARLR